MSRKKKVFKPTCRYCRFYYLHTCTVFGEKVESTSSACNDFELADMFWCDKNGYKMSTAACFNRQENNYPGCVRCLQGKSMGRFVKQRQLALFDRFSSQRIQRCFSAGEG
jgi:hypothetical protein